MPSKIRRSDRHQRRRPHDITFSTDATWRSQRCLRLRNMFPLFGLQPHSPLFHPSMTAAQRSPYASSPGLLESPLRPRCRVLGAPFTSRPSLRDRRCRAAKLHRHREGTVTEIFLPLNMNGFATQDSITWHLAFLMLKPGVDSATVLEPCASISLL